ncbi:MAG: TrkA family potassium uptake protein [Alkaliphilus sp.]|mgnify:CR=1 FL=1|nr:TrkA family potassium uptake protein [Alkaliphilus sp.]
MKQFAVIGCGRFGSSLAKTLYQLGHEVLAIDNNEHAIQELADHVTHAVQINASDEASLKALGIRNFDVVIVSIGSDIQSSILTTLLAKEIGAKFVVAKAHDELHAKILYKIGADRVVLPERDMGVRVAHNLVSPNILDYIELAPDFSVAEITPLSGWIGKELKEINLREKYGVNIMAIKHKSEVNISPNSRYVISADDIIIVVGHNDDMQKIKRN